MKLAAAVAALNLFAIGNDAERLAAHGEHIDVAAPNWYALDARGRLTGGGNDPYVQAAQRHGTEVWPVVNAKLGFRTGWLGPQRRAVARRVARVARTFDGVTLDVEEIPPQRRAAYSRFVADVASRSRDGGVAVYTVRRTAAPPLRSAAAYDHRALARSADLVLASGYGEHSPRSEPGPLTTAAGFADVLEYARSISRRRVAPVLGGFGVSWPIFGGDGEVVSATDLPPHTNRAIRDHRLVFYEPAPALRARARAARAAGMRWIALFSLGREPRGFWPRG